MPVRRLTIVGACPGIAVRSPSVPGISTLLPGAEDVLSAGVTLTPGAHTLRWQVLAVDGHITRGEVPFTVTAS